MIAMDEKQDTEFLTPDQIAKKLNVRERKVLDLIKQGEIIGVRVGKQWRVTPAEYQAFLKRNQNERRVQE